MKKKIPVLVFQDVNSGEAAEVFRLDKLDHRHKFALTLLADQTERDVKHTITVTEMSKRQWKDCEDAGKFEGGLMSDRQEAQYLAKLKRRKKR